MINIGFVSEVNSKYIIIRLLENNTQEIIYRNGIRYEMPKINQYLKVKYLDIDIIVQVESEYIEKKIDKINEERLEDKNLFERILKAKIVGYFTNGNFNIGPKYSPIVFNKVSLLREDEILKILNVDKKELDKSITIGKSIINNDSVDIGIAGFFNSHMAIFGNTGSGKSNTLTKIYTELFDKYETNTSRFIFIDFNGEYEGQSVLIEGKKVVKCSTVGINDKINLPKELFQDPEIMSVIYNATEKTQKPFLVSVLNSWEFNNSDINNYIFNVFNKIFESQKNISSEIKTLIDRILELINEITGHQYYIRDDIRYHTKNKYFYKEPEFSDKYYPNECELNVNENSEFYFNGNFLKDECIEINISDINIEEINKFDELLLRLELKLLTNILYNNDRYEFINPLINMVSSKNVSLKKVFCVEHDVEINDNIIVYSLKDCNQEMKKIIPLIVAKKEYVELKKDNDIKSTHFIIDEAHNILSEDSNREGKGWKDYRLETFEELIKEGRKFGFFITISSQRPSDISTTIVSQMHNFLIHKLINDNDLNMVKNVVTTLSSKENEFIPQMGKGMCVISGTNFLIPKIIQVDRIDEEENRPNSDDIDLDWEKK